MKAIILAAGKGKRMGKLTQEKPKAMIELKGKPLIEWVLERTTKAGFEEIGIIVGYKGEQIKKYFGKEFKGTKIAYFEQKEQKGNANAIALAENFVEGDFIAIHADVIPETGLLNELKEKKGFDTVVVARKEKQAWKFGVLEIKGEKIVKIVEKPKEKILDAWVSAGIFRFSKKIFPAIRKTKKSPRGELEITDSISMLMEKETVAALKWSKPIIDISTKQELEQAKKARVI